MAGRDGFVGASSCFYHRNPPTAWIDAEAAIQHRAFNVANCDAQDPSPWAAAELIGNNNLRLRYWRVNTPMDHLVRNADGDELLFLHRGSGDFFCDYGHIALSEGDYLVLPKGCTWRYEPLAATEMLLLEATSAAFSLPSPSILGRTAPFDPGVFGVPSLDEQFFAQSPHGRWQIRIKRRGKVALVTYPFNPLDATSWKGDLYPIRLSVRDIRPVMSHRVHIPPSAHTTFLSDRFVVCTIVPRPGESDPEAFKFPTFHDNVDYDEMLFFHRGVHVPQRAQSFVEGMLSLHPAGLVHGPHPNVLARFGETNPIALEATFILIDSRDPLDVLPGGNECEVAGYGLSWRGSVDYAPDAK
jgi:homogentisate 1,2-dioxygenase